MRFLPIFFVFLTPSIQPIFAEPGSPSKTPQKLDYTRDVKPILANTCFACHGPDEKSLKGKLRLDSREAALKGGKSGEPAIVPNKPDQSELIHRIFSKEKTEVMPPPHANKSLKPEEKEILKRWILEGADYQTHWAFTKPNKAPVPVFNDPKDKAWVMNPIDAFVLAKLKQAKLQPSSPADKVTLIRRVSLDLRGFSPSLEEIDQFLQDISPKAYENMVDRMLASNRYGEKMAAQWLDLARFGDTSGYHYDSTRQMWLYRDWLIRAFNENKPFDQFTIEELAGDLLPNPTLDQKVASGFNRNTRFNEEGGADPEEFVIRYGVDRTNTLGQVWLGMTLQCAECHTHKYDPITQKEYYQLYAFFTGIKEPMTSGNHGQPLPPLLKIPTPEQEKILAQAKKQREEVLAQINQKLQTTKYQEPPLDNLPKPEPKEIVWVDDTLPKGAIPQGDGEKFKFVEAPAPVLSGKKSVFRTAMGLQQAFFTGATETLTINSPADVLFAYVYLDPKNPPKTIMLQFNNGNWEHRAYWGEDKAYLAGSPDGPNHRKMGPLPKTGEWVRLEVTASQVGLNQNDKLNGLAFTQVDGVIHWDKAGIKQLPPDTKSLFSLAAWEVNAKKDNKLPPEVQNALKVEASKRNDAQKKTILDYYLRNVYQNTRAVFEPLNKQLAELDAQIKQTEEAVPTTLISEEMEKPRDAYVLIRGDFLQKGEKVSRGLPQIFPPMPKDAPLNRLGLAKWLTSPEHPLTARVAVNRLWGQLFGNGLVRTQGDFGTQGELPSHPELLDYLAVEFVESGWDIKKLLKMMLMSNTYQQTSAFEGNIPDVDPSNRLLYKAPRFRITAEEIRDNALAISGLLSNKIGGPSVMPYQPPDFYKGKHEGWQWKPAEGEDQYRRGLYTFWRRTSLHPMFALFDAPSREECTTQRARTNTPLQALVTMNDPTFVEASRVFAQNVLTQGPATLEEKVEWAFRRALSRKPSAAERAVLLKRYEILLDRYRKEPALAQLAVKVGQYPQPQKVDVAEHAAWMGICNILLNLDETITRE
ncbi:MAG: PSD1 and planctomycete cytochrome C domain-containing protein [Gemmataceae bacterium]|nr:PSD1 and planctomycete cytochrome C domain-containing protein [Gemmataceae bacterium]